MFKRATGKAVLIADIDDASVGVSIVELEKHGRANIIAIERKVLSVEERTGVQNVAGITQLLEQCVAALLKTPDVPVPTHAYAILRAPWTRFRTAQFAETYPEPRAITKEVIASLAKKALEAPSELDKGNVFEQGVMQVFLNGYPVGSPIGKKAASAMVVAFESDSNAEMKRAVVDAIGKHLPGREVVILSGMRTLLSVLHELIPDIHRYVVIDVGGTATNCSVIRKEAVSQFAQVPEGEVTIIKRVSDKGLPEEIRTQLRMLANDTCSTDACKALKDSLAHAEQDLAKTFGDMLGSLAVKRRLPNTVMLSAPAELTPWLHGFFSRIDFAQFTATMQPLAVESLTPELLHDLVSWKVGVQPDTGLGIGAGYVNILND
jgi:hypothetical protein